MDVLAERGALVWGLGSFFFLDSGGGGRLAGNACDVMRWGAFGGEDGWGWRWMDRGI